MGLCISSRIISRWQQNPIKMHLKVKIQNYRHILYYQHIVVYYEIWYTFHCTSIDKKLQWSKVDILLYDRIWSSTDFTFQNGILTLFRKFVRSIRSLCWFRNGKKRQGLVSFIMLSPALLSSLNAGKTKRLLINYICTAWRFEFFFVYPYFQNT